MRIAFIGGFAFSPKGTIRSRAFPLASELAHLGHQVSIFLVPYDNPADSGRQWESEGVRVCNVATSPLSSLSFRSTAAALAAVRRLLTAVTQYKPDVTHVFKPKGFAGAAATYWLLKGMKSLVVDCDDWEGWGGWNDVKDYPWGVKECIDRQERWLIRHAPALTTASRTLYTRASAIRASDKHLFYIPNCGPSREILSIHVAARSSSQTAMRRKWGLPDGPLVLYGGHFDAAEDAEFFCAASREVLARHGAGVVFVGEGPSLSRVRDFYSHNRSVPKYFFPHLPYEEFIQLVRASDIAAFPLGCDHISAAKCSARIIDYMAMGRAVITSDVGQNSEYIVNGESGLLTVPGDREHFSTGLDQLLADSELRQRLGRNAEFRIAEHFKWDGEPLQHCLAAYDAVLSHPSTLHSSKSAQCPVSSS